MGLDARVRYTKKVIRDVFLSLLREKNVKQITVTELLEQIEVNALDYLRETAQEIQGEDAMGRFVSLLEQTREHHEEFAVIGSENGDPHFSRRASVCLYEAARDTVFRHLPAGTEDEKAMICRFLEGGGSGVLDFWLCGGMRQEPEEVARFIFSVSRTVMQG